ncbi:delta-lactam-biosynthetic de-N-acetylase [Weizmannia acidilactici]|uniref:Delta-lactam-biosynthetic de-N-acetylase n=1 Tax=Weizmannia acidilactici TaxID=2607726 RepID=A0A5J4J6P6_9BACI|nr:delta-lactam-biosynthetic de-N-acetylase [Weizmannia acidilactici]GER68463.1 delta-lactam-biosynthetic de-N-acetylase [Weizmannia acidilactici]GER70592.1 delta-lactam-biosynthetic de-N-acetylase [Weizmannia acidilactici]GER73766.1 delta-lactam-biosynthetic de-N-acetylase [Weizmannia acidilactici]
MKKGFVTAFAVFLFFSVFPHVETFAIANTPIHWGFNKGKNGQQADAGAAYNAVLQKYGGVYKGNPKDKYLYLTFDNGYENGYTPKILDVLKKEKVPAIFFVTGHYLKSQPDLVKRMVAEGHIIGNHSWGHPDMTQISDAQVREELAKVKEETARITGQKEMKYLRPPRGILSERTMQLANEEGYTHVLWSLAYQDWDVNRQHGARYAYDSIMSQIHPGAIILLHTVSKDNAEVLERVIKDLKKQGYKFKSMDDFMKIEKVKK